MKIYKKLILSSFVGLFCLMTSWAQSETLEDLAKEVSNIQAELKSLPTSSLEEAILIDNAIKVIGQAANLVTESISKGDTAAALATINFLNESIGDIVSQTPKDFITEKTESDLSAFSKEDMKEIQIITKSMKKRKKEKMKTLVQDMVVINKKGVDTFAMSKELNNIGVETITAKEVKAVVKTVSKKQIQSLTEIKTMTQATTEIKPEEKFSAFVGETEEEVSMSLRQVEVLKSGDNVKQRAYDIEKYGKMVGLSDDEIKQGVSAVKAGDWEGQKEVVAKIYEAGGIEVTEAELNAEMEQEMIDDAALNAIMNGKGKSPEELAQQVKGILSNNESLSKDTIERVYYTVLLGAQGDIPIGDEEIEISYNDIAAEAKAKMSEDPDIERAFWTTQLTGAIPTYNLDGTVQTIEDVTKDNDIEVAAEVAAIMSGEVSDYDRVKAQLEKTGPIPVYDIQVTEATAEVAQEAAAETTEAVAEVAQEAAAETTEAVAEVAQEAAAETTEAVAEVAQEAAAEVSQEVAEVAQEVSQEVAEVAQEAVKEVAEEVAKSAKDIASEIRAEVASAEKEWSDLAASGASYQEQMSAFQKYGAAVQKLSRLPQSEGGASAEK